MITADRTQHPEDEDIDVDLLEYLQTLTPAQRIERHEAALEDLIASKRKLARPKDLRVARELELVLAPSRVREADAPKIHEVIPSRGVAYARHGPT